VILQRGQLVKRVFSVSAILIHDTLQTTSPFTDAVEEYVSLNLLSPKKVNGQQNQ